MHQADLFAGIDDAPAQRPVPADCRGPRAIEREAAESLRAHFAGTATLALTPRLAAVQAIAANPDADDHPELLTSVCHRYGAGDATFGPYTEVTAAIEGLARLPAWRRRRLLVGLVRRRALEPTRLTPRMQAEWAALGPNREEQLQTFLRDGSPELRRAACWVAADFDLTRLVGVIRPLLDDPITLVAASAAVTLGRLGDPAARPHLERMIRVMGDGSRHVVPVQEILDGLLPVATADSIVVLRQAARRLTGDAGTAAAEALAELDTD